MAGRTNKLKSKKIKRNTSRKHCGGGKDDKVRSRSRSRSPPTKRRKPTKVEDAEKYVNKKTITKLDVIITMFDEDHSLFDDMRSIIEANDFYKTDSITLNTYINKLERLFNRGIFDNETEIKNILSQLLSRDIFYFLYLSEQQKLDAHEDALHSNQIGTLEPMPLVDIKKNIVYLKYISDQ